MKDFEVKKFSGEIEIDFISSWLSLFPSREERYKRRINIILSEYMYFVTPFI